MIFPLAAAAPALTLMLDGTVLRSYLPARLERGHVVAPVDPFVTRVADSIAYCGGYMVISRGDRFVQVRLQRRDPGELKETYVELAPLLRTLGEGIRYDAQLRVLEIRSPKVRAVPTATPFNPAVPRAAPTAVFTPSPIPTPQPVFTGPPVPRRTPIPYQTPEPSPSP